MKDQNVQASPDVQVGETIYGIEHPDPRMRPARLSIRIPALFWGRVRRHLERCQSSPAERRLWEQWLSPQAVGALLSESDSPSSPRFGSTAFSLSVPDAAFHHLRTTIIASLRHPLALRLDSEPAGRPGSPATDPTYLLVLTNGATVVMRIANTTVNTNIPSHDETIPARLDDCFFTRAAAEFARPAGDFALAGSPAGAQKDYSFPTSHGSLRDAVVREWVGRYAMAIGEENSKGLVPPDRPCDVNGSLQVGSAVRTISSEISESIRGADPTETASNDRAASSKRLVHFLTPTDWGFSGGPNGCVWVGYESAYQSEISTSPDSEALRRLFGEAGEGQGRQSALSSKNTKPSLDSRAQRRTTRIPLSLTGADSPRANQSRPGGLRRSVANDPLVCLPELNRAMEEFPWFWVSAGESRPERTESSHDGAAYRSAIALGRCRLLGSSRAELAEMTLTPAVGMSAARELAVRLKQWAGRAKSLPADMRGATAPRASDLCMGVLEARIEAWAAYLAIDESYSTAVDAADVAAHDFSQAIDALLDGIAEFDDAIQFAEPLVASVAGGPGSRLLENWKKLLAAPYRQSPPWWLDCAARAALDADEAW